jgi:hypothetical protein
MKDPIGVGKYSVTVAPPSPGNRKKLLQRLDVMTRELAHAQMAVAQLRHALQHSGSTRPLADGIMNSRNWVLSLVISHSFIQTMLDNENPYFSMAAIQTRMMAGNAAQEGMEQARREHIKDLHQP